MELKRFYTTEQLSEHMAETPEGFLICFDVPVARIGEYIYKSNEVPVEGGRDGIVKIQRDEDEVFKEETIKSFEGKPVTINHPNDFVTPENWKDLAHGVVQNVRRGEGEKEDLLIADLCITTADAIKLVKSGLRQVSCGYDAQYDQIQPGLGRQKDIVGNHLALVVKGRAGNRCAIMDKACECCGNCSCKNNSMKEDSIKMKSNPVKDVLRKLFPKLNLDHVKDEDLELGEQQTSGSDVEVAQRAAAEAKASAQQAVESAQQAASAVESIQAGGAEAATPKEEVPTEETPAPAPAAAPIKEEDQGEQAGASAGGGLAELNSKIDALTSLMQELIDTISNVGAEPEEEGMEEGAEEGAEAGVEEGAEETPEEGAEAAPEEEEGKESKDGEGGTGSISPVGGSGRYPTRLPSDFNLGEGLDPSLIVGDEDEGDDEKKKEKENRETKDAIWLDTISRADLIAPGIVAPKPKSSDMKKVVSAVKRRALSEGMTKDNASVIRPLLRGRKITQLTEDALDATFVAASEMIARVNNAKVQKKSMQMKDLSSFNDLSAINQRNKEFWKRK